MRLGRRPLALFLICLPVLGLSVLLLAPGGQTWLELTDAETGRRIISQPLQSGEEVVLTWKNSLFGLQVTEVFVAADGILLLTQITFADPRGGEPFRVKPGDVDDLYHTGGPFKATGLSRPFNRIVFRVGEIGDPKIRAGTELVSLTREVGFGGAVLLVARKPSVYETTLGRWLH